jgi:hypothetical protein
LQRIEAGSSFLAGESEERAKKIKLPLAGTALRYFLLDS